MDHCWILRYRCDHGLDLACQQAPPMVYERMHFYILFRSTIYNVFNPIETRATM